eukprot:evm.model.scf_889EXC.5 EVM.evm.TU.scf_889EXC.5   scf_889EXC:33857-38088(-)
MRDWPTVPLLESGGDPRLRPRNPAWIILSLALSFVGGMLVVFFLVPRGMGIVSSGFNVTTIYLNQSDAYYKLVVKVEVPIFNDNYMDAHLSGDVTMRFYDSLAGHSFIPSTRIHKRTKGQVVTTVVDASFVPYQYISRVLNSCSMYPDDLVLFVEGRFEIHRPGHGRNLTLDTYTVLECPIMPPAGPTPLPGLQSTKAPAGKDRP